MSPTNFDPRQAIQQFFSDQLTGRQLLRGFASYPHWLVPAGFEGGEPTFLNFRLGESECHLFMFSDQEAYTECRSTLGMDVLGEYHIDTSGRGAWGNIGPDVNMVNINPYTQQQIHYKEHQIPTLRSWAKIIEVEEALENILSSNQGFDVIKGFPEYYFVMHTDESGPHLLLAPDNKGRRLAALFTAEDSLDAYLAELGEQLTAEINAGSVQPLLLAGEELFKSLQQMPLDGIVFNCSGPIQPRAFALAFCEEVLSEG